MKAERSRERAGLFHFHLPRRCAGWLMSGGLLLSAGACAMPGRLATTQPPGDPPAVDTTPDDDRGAVANPDPHVYHAVVADPAHRAALC